MEHSRTGLSWGVLVFVACLSILSLIIASCALVKEAEVDFPSNTDFDNATSLSDIEAEETSGFCEATGAKVVFTAASGGTVTYDYGSIDAGESKQPTVGLSGDFSDTSSWSRSEEFDSGSCSGVLGTPVI